MSGEELKPNMGKDVLSSAVRDASDLASGILAQARVSGKLEPPNSQVDAPLLYSERKAVKVDEMKSVVAELRSNAAKVAETVGDDLSSVAAHSRDGGIEEFKDFILTFLGAVFGVPLALAIITVLGPFLLAKKSWEWIRRPLHAKAGKNLARDEVETRKLDHDSEKISHKSSEEYRYPFLEDYAHSNPSCNSPTNRHARWLLPRSAGDNDPVEALGLETEGEVDAYLAWKKEKNKPRARECRDRSDDMFGGRRESASMDAKTTGASWVAEVPKPKLAYGVTQCKSSASIISFDRLAAEGDEKN